MILEVREYSFKHISNNTFVKLDIVPVVAAKLATILQFHNQESFSPSTHLPLMSTVAHTHTPLIQHTHQNTHTHTHTHTHAITRIFTFISLPRTHSRFPSGRAMIHSLVLSSPCSLLAEEK